MRLPFALAALAALALGHAVPAAASEAGPVLPEEPGPYIAVRASLGALDDLDFDTPGGRETLEMEGGVALSAAAGYRFARVVRTDLEVLLAAHGVDALRPVAGPRLDVDATVGAVAALANAYLDLPLGRRVAPYVGAGAGVAYLSLESDDDAILGDASDTVFAYQGAAGLTVRVSPLVSLFSGYRFFATADPDLGGRTGYRTHNLDLGLRFDF